MFAPKNILESRAIFNYFHQSTRLTGRGSWKVTKDKTWLFWEQVRQFQKFFFSKENDDVSITFSVYSVTSELTYLFPMHPFSTSWKHQKTVMFSNLFRGWRKGALGKNGLILLLLKHGENKNSKTISNTKTKLNNLSSNPFSYNIQYTFQVSNT